MAAAAIAMATGIELKASVGLDVALHDAKILAPVAGRKVAAELEDLVAAGSLGKKSGQGIYLYADGKAVKPPSGEGQVPADIQDRLILSMVNESVACLSEGVVAEADLLDAGVIFGTGFAPFRGGPLNYARERGIQDVLAALGRLAATHGERFSPHDGWSDL